MSARAAFFWALSFLRDGTRSDAGSLTNPVKEVETDLDVDKTQEFTVAADSKVVLWDYAEFLDFAHVVVEVLDDEGLVVVSHMVDTCVDIAADPLTDADLQPSGTNERWNHAVLSCDGIWTLCSNVAYVNPVLADHAGSSGDYPTLPDDAGTVEGRVYRITVWNPSATTACRVRITMRG
jgi:hypothetical protein